MLLTHPRKGLLYVCLAGMEMAWFAPLFLFFFQPARTWPPLIAFAGLLVALLLLVSTLELLNHLGVEPPAYHLVVLGLILLSSLLAVRIGLYAQTPLIDFGWLANTFDAVFNLPQGLRPELILILTGLFLWQRATNATSRDLGFFSVGLSFRMGLLLLILGAGLISLFGGKNALPFLWLYFGLGLITTSLARTQEKASEARSVGVITAPRRLVQLALAVAATLGLASWVSLYYTPDGIGTLVKWLEPVWRVISPLFKWLGQFLIWALGPAVDWLLQRIIDLFSNLNWASFSELSGSSKRNPFAVVTEQGDTVTQVLPPWAWTALRYGVIALGIAIVLGIILLYLDRIRTRAAQDESEEIIPEDITLGGNALRRGIDWLRNLAGLVRRFGLSRDLLAAISVQNIYANLCRLARRRGYPRHPAQPPDGYLPTLMQAFTENDDALARITTAYMRVHYGDQAIPPNELAQLQKDYQQIRKSPDGPR